MAGHTRFLSDFLLNDDHVLDFFVKCCRVNCKFIFKVRRGLPIPYSLDAYLLYLFIHSPFIIAYLFGFIVFITKKQKVKYPISCATLFLLVFLFTMVDPWITSPWMTAQNIHIISFIRMLIQALPLILLIFVYYQKERN